MHVDITPVTLITSWRGDCWVTVGHTNTPTTCLPAMQAWLSWVGKPGAMVTSWLTIAHTNTFTTLLCTKMFSCKANDSSSQTAEFHMDACIVSCFILETKLARHNTHNKIKARVEICIMPPVNSLSELSETDLLAMQLSHG